MSPTYQAPVASGTVPTLQNTRPCGCGATASVKIKYGLEASLCRFFAQRTMVWSQTRTQQQVVPLGSDVLLNTNTHRQELKECGGSREQMDFCHCNEDMVV